MARTILLSVMVMIGFGATAATAPADPPTDLTGAYRCEGVNPDGTPYEGVVEIEKLRNTFRVRWILNDAVVLGVGIFSSDVFAVSYFDRAPAVVVYKLDGTRLVGEWTMGGIEGTLYTETLTKMPGRPELRRPRSTEPSRPGIQIQTIGDTPLVEIEARTTP